ncbi:MAG: DUF3649 domain-containing protein [Xenophilus sp.]
MSRAPAPTLATSPASRLAQWLQRPWLGVLSRSCAAIFGGYALASALALLMSLALPMPRSQAVLTGMMSGIVVCACAALWAFAVRSALRAWLGIAAPALLMFGLAALLQRGAA